MDVVNWRNFGKTLPQAVENVIQVLRHNTDAHFTWKASSDEEANTIAAALTAAGIRFLLSLDSEPEEEFSKKLEAACTIPPGAPNATQMLIYVDTWEDAEWARKQKELS